MLANVCSSMLIAVIVLVGMVNCAQEEFQGELIVNGSKVDPLELDMPWETAIRMVLYGNHRVDGEELDRGSTENVTDASGLLEPTLSDWSLSSPTMETLKDEDKEEEEDDMFKEVAEATVDAVKLPSEPLGSPARSTNKQSATVDDRGKSESDEEEGEEGEDEPVNRDRLLASLVAEIFEPNAFNNLTEASDPRLVWQTLYETWQMQFSRTMRALTPAVMDAFYRVPDLSTECSSALVRLINAAQADEIWAYEILQSSGQLPVGFVTGTLSSFGDYDQCLAAGHRVDPPTIVGKYCLLEVALPTLSQYNSNISLLVDSAAHLKLMSEEIPREVAASLTALHSAFYSANLTIGLCLPSPCAGDEIVDLFRLVTGRAIRLNIGHCRTQAPKSSSDWTQANVKRVLLRLDNFQQISATFVIFSLISTLFATLFDICRGHKQSEAKTKVRKNVLVDCFSLRSNWRHLVTASQKSSGTSGRLDFIEGFRVLTIVWVMACHVFSIGCLNVPAILYRISEEARPFTFTLANQIFYNGFATVEIFFFISGFLLAHSHLSKRRNSSTPLWDFVLRRYLQLAIPMAAIVACLFLWPLLLADGPLFNRISANLINACRTRWWKNLALMNNFDRLDDLCLLHTWFLSADFQMHVLAYPMLLTLGLAAPLIPTTTIGALFGVIGLVVPGYLTYWYRIPPTLNVMNEIRLDDYNDHLALIYYPFYNHWAAYLVGFLLALYLKQAQKKQEPKPEVTITFSAPVRACEQFRLVLLTIISVAISGLAIFASYFWAGDGTQLDDGRLLKNALYRSFYPLLVVVSIAWVTGLCVLYPRNILDRFLSSTFFVRLGPLTAAIYLVHLPIVWHLVLRSRAPLHATYVDFTSILGATLIYSIPLAIIFQLMLVAPYLRLAFEGKGRLVAVVGAIVDATTTNGIKTSEEPSTVL